MLEYMVARLPLMRVAGRGRAAGILAAGLMLFPSAQVAQACSFGANTHQLDPAEKEVDSTPPGTPVVGPVKIARGRGPQRAGCGESASSCDDIGSIEFALSASDDRTAASMMGFRIVVARGNAPSSLFPLSMDVRPSGGTMWVRWADGATDDQESLDFDLEVRAIDLAGNVSAEGAVVKVRQDVGGCSIGGGSTQTDDGMGIVALGMLATWAVGRRRRGHARVLLGTGPRAARRLHSGFLAWVALPQLFVAPPPPPDPTPTPQEWPQVRPGIWEISVRSNKKPGGQMERSTFSIPSCRDTSGLFQGYWGRGIVERVGCHFESVKTGASDFSVVSECVVRRVGVARSVATVTVTGDTAFAMSIRHNERRKETIVERAGRWVSECPKGGT